MARDKETLDPFRRRDQFREQPSTGSAGTCRARRCQTVSGPDRELPFEGQSGAATGYGPSGANVAEILLEPPRAVGPDCVAIVVAGHDRDPVPIVQKPCRAPSCAWRNSSAQRGRGQVAGDQDVIGLQALDACDQLGHPLESESPARAQQQRGYAQESLAQ